LYSFVKQALPHEYIVGYALIFLSPTQLGALLID